MSLYNIEAELNEIFAQIEEAEGEITPEQEKLLEIKEEELKNKLSSYRKAITIWQNDVESCKAEIKRINDICKTRTNRVNRLKLAMLNAVQHFGNSAKNNKYIELEDCRLSTRNSTSVEFDEKRNQYFIDAFLDTIKELVENDILECGNNIDIDGILSTINAKASANWNFDELGEFIPFTVQDFSYIELEFNIKHTPLQLFTFYKSFLEYIGDDNCECEPTIGNSKIDIKNIINSGLERDITFAKLNQNQSLIIK